MKKIIGGMYIGIDGQWKKGLHTVRAYHMNEKDYFEELKYLQPIVVQVEPDETTELDFSL